MSDKKQKINFLELLVKTVPFKYNLKKYKPCKRAVEQLGYEVDDAHRFRNSVYVYEATKKKKEENVKRTEVVTETLKEEMFMTER